MKRVFLYCRVSTANQVEGDGFDRQEKTCRDFAGKQGWSVLRVFKEQQTGSDEWADRKLLSEAMELCSGAPCCHTIADFNAMAINAINCGSTIDSGATDTIIIERADRLSRDLIVSELFLRDCKARGVKVYAADSGEEIVNSNGDPTRTLIRQVLAAVSQWEKSVIVKKMQAGRRATALKTGKPCGGPKPNPYGDRGTLAQRNEERAVLREIMRLRFDGHSFETIATRLRNARVKNPNGDMGRRVPGVNPAFTWSGKMVERLFNRWENRAEVT